MTLEEALKILNDLSDPQTRHSDETIREAVKLVVDGSSKSLLDQAETKKAIYTWGTWAVRNSIPMLISLFGYIVMTKSWVLAMMLIGRWEWLAAMFPFLASLVGFGVAFSSASWLIYNNLRNYTERKLLEASNEVKYLTNGKQEYSEPNNGKQSDKIYKDTSENDVNTTENFGVW